MWRAWPDCTPVNKIRLPSRDQRGAAATSGASVNRNCFFVSILLSHSDPPGRSTYKSDCPSGETTASSARRVGIKKPEPFVFVSIFFSSRCDRKLNANTREPVCAGIETCSESGPRVSCTGPWLVRRNQFHVSRIPHRLHSSFWQPENKKYFPSAVHWPEDCETGDVPRPRTRCNLLPSAFISQIVEPLLPPFSLWKRIVSPSPDHAGACGCPLGCAISWS